MTVLDLRRAYCLVFSNVDILHIVVNAEMTDLNPRGRRRDVQIACKCVPLRHLSQGCMVVEVPSSSRHLDIANKIVIILRSTVCVLLLLLLEIILQPKCLTIRNRLHVNLIVVIVSAANWYDVHSI